MHIEDLIINLDGTRSAADLVDPHILTAVHDDRELAQTHILESLHVA